MRLWITTALVALLAALLWPVGGQTRADAPPAEITETTALRYETYDLMGKAATPGSYAFLPGSDDATGVVATYEGLRDGTAKRLLIHKTDAQGTSRATLYDAVAAGAFFEWHQADDCWVRYRVTEVLPDPPSAEPRKLLAVEWATYAFTGCSGPIAASTAAVIEWGPLLDLGGASLTSPVVHGPYQLVPEIWRGAVQEPRTYPSPGYSAANPAYTQDLAAARQLPYWRDPALPAGWTFSWATAGDVSGPTYGYWAEFATERGGHGVTIFGYYADYRGHPEDASWLNARGAFETRSIAGRPARVAYSPPGPSHDDLFPLTVWIYDPSTEAEYAVLGKAKSLRGSNVDAVIAIARSLFEEADEATAAPQDPAGPSEPPAPSAGPKPLFEWWADGRPTSLPLDLKLRSSRELCTAGTLTEISWEISGGVAPYRLTVEGAAVDVDADNVRVNCGALTEAEAGDAEAALAAKTVSAVVTDSRDIQRTAKVEVARARAVRAPSRSSPATGVQPTGAGVMILTGDDAWQPDLYGEGRYLVRHRPAGSSGEWSYVISGWTTRIGIEMTASEHTAQLAYLRHPLEAETPEALNWNSPETYARLKPPPNLRATATHDTVTVRFDDQPGRWGATVSLSLYSPSGELLGSVQKSFHSLYDTFVAPGNTPREVVFKHAPPDSAFKVYVSLGTPYTHGGGTRAETTVRTAPAPPGWTPPPEGPQNLRATATHDSITVRWDPPYDDAESGYELILSEAETGRWIHGFHPGWDQREWTLRGGLYERLQPNTSYRVFVTYRGIPYSSAEIIIGTLSSPPVRGAEESDSEGAAGRGRSLERSAGQPRFEWWADGRPTSPPLHMKLRSSRELCTAGTLTEVSWTISGGVAPYELSIEGEAVDVDADNVRVNCGALTEAEAGDAEAALATKTVSATVTDSRGVQRQAALDIARARALPAPQNVGYDAHVAEVGVYWDEVNGAGAQSPTTVDPDTQNRLTVTGMIRTRANQDGAGWTYHTVNRSHPYWTLDPPVEFRVLSVAAVRHPLELETPAALNWSDEIVYTAMKLAQNVTIAATHDTMTVSWDRQPYAAGRAVWVLLYTANDVYVGRNGSRLVRLREEEGVSGRHEVAFAQLPPDTDLAVLIVMGGDAINARSTTHPVRTQTPPAGWAAPPSGPQNLRYASANDTLTVYWDEPYSAEGTSWSITITNPTTGTTYRTGSYSSSWTWPQSVSRLPNKEYHITIAHTDLGRGAAEITVRTPPARPAGQAESLASFARPEPLFEWWADGRPTSPPLDLKLESSRDLCTAGTLTEISWQISGGVAPYELSIESAAVDLDADNIRINCGALTEAEAGDADAALAAKTVTATVTDSRGVQRQAALDVARARALPAPQNVGYWSSVSGVVLRWDRVAGAGSQSPLTIHPVSKNRLLVSGLVRTRANSDGAAWSYHTVEMLGHSELFVEPPPQLRVFSAAAVRHPLELETPGALNWSDEVAYAATKPAQNVTLATTHDTVTASWDRQPYAVGQQILVWLFNDAAGNESWQYEHLSEEPGVTGRHTVTFTNLPPDTRLRLMIAMGDEISTRHYVRTRAAPSGWTPPPAGPRNLRYELDGDILTVLWDNPYAGAQQDWLLTIENPATGNSWLTDVYGTSWTLPGWLGVFPNTQYRVTVEHRSGMPPGSSSILITTPSPPTGQ